MKTGKEGSLHLAYCTKIHPANGWPELFANIRSYVPALKSSLCPDQPFGIALRLSATESVQLLEPSLIREFKAYLREEDLYVFTVNGFPYGSFFGQPVKSQIFAPDWRDELRVQYTVQLIEVLWQLLPEGTEGSISTLPLSYKSWITNNSHEEAMAGIVHNLVRVVAALVTIRREQGLNIHLDIEPEPDGLLENCREFVQFYRQWLLSYGAPVLAGKMGVPLAEAHRQIRNHIRLCLDTCHLAVAYEEPLQVLSLLEAEGISVGKVQVASGLKAFLPESPARRTGLYQSLEQFAHSLYLHQVIGRSSRGAASRFPDLGAALPHLEGCRDEEWRIHYHMPLFVEQYRLLQTTHAETLQVLQLLKDRGFTGHLEIETYTWKQLPEDLKIDLFSSLLKEYQWVLAAMGPSVRPDGS